MSNPGPATTTNTGLQNLSSDQAIRLIGKINGASLSAVGDNIIPCIATSSFSVTAVIVTNASASLAQAYGALYTAPAAGGTAIVSAAALSAATGAGIVVAHTIASTANPGITAPQNTLYYRCTTANTAAATADVYVYGYVFDSLVN
jgi:hypothetical protein